MAPISPRLKGPYHLLPARRLLLEGDKAVRLGSRALDILIALVERAGELVGKDELMARVWPNTFVEEGNLKFQIGALRRTLGDGDRYLVNVPGRGYCFVAPVALADCPRQSPPQAAATEHAHNLPAQLTRLVGRADIVSGLAGLLPRQRFLTIVGPGGIGKTSVALAVAEALPWQPRPCRRAIELRRRPPARASPVQTSPRRRCPTMVDRRSPVADKSSIIAGSSRTHRTSTARRVKRSLAG
jgi:DNA-binding winged helix-turn-helix (wHTH) protein